MIRYFLPPFFLLVVISPGLVFTHLGHTVPPQYIILCIELLDLAYHFFGKSQTPSEAKMSEGGEEREALFN